MKKFLIAFAAFLVVGISLAGNTKTNMNEKVTICHRTGNGSSHEITVSINAVPAHLAHGDAIGDCEPVNTFQ